MDELGRRLQCVPRILAHLNQRHGSPLESQDLPDLVQSCLVVIWKKLPDFEARSELETWAYRISYLEFLNAARHRRRMRERGHAGDPGPAPSIDHLMDRDPGPGHWMEHQELFQTLSHLDEIAEKVLRLRHYEELTFDEIARRLSLSPSRAKARYYDSLVRLRRMLRDDWQGDRR